MRMFSIGAGCAAFVLSACLAAPAAGQSAVAEPSLRVAVIIDGSGTFAGQRDAAVARTIDLLDAMAATKLHRWEIGADHVTLISLDALPEVIWQGTLRQLKELDHDRWAARFDARSDFVHCTDVAAAFRLAADAVAGGAGPVNQYLFAFSDLIHEPPTTSVRTCAAPQTLPPAAFPWDRLSGCLGLGVLGARRPGAGVASGGRRPGAGRVVPRPLGVRIRGDSAGGAATAGDRALGGGLGR